MTRLAEAAAVVTGGGSGLGAALAGELAARGATAVLLDLREDRISQIAERIQAGGKPAAGFAADVGNRDQVRQVFAEIGRRFGRIDLLAKVAGRSMLVPFLEMSDDDLDWVLGPNLLGVVYCMRAAAPWMPPGSRIVNVTSVSGRVPTPGEALYSAAKAGVVSLSESLEAELAGRGIGITVVLPGEMSTNLFAEHPSWERRPDFQRRLESPPERVARAIVRAIERDRFELVVPLSMRMTLWLQRLAPGFFRRGVGRFYRRVFEPRIAARDAKAQAKRGAGA